MAAGPGYLRLLVCLCPLWCQGWHGTKLQRLCTRNGPPGGSPACAYSGKFRVFRRQPAS